MRTTKRVERVFRVEQQRLDGGALNGPIPSGASAQVPPGRSVRRVAEACAGPLELAAHVFEGASALLCCGGGGGGWKEQGTGSCGRTWGRCCSLLA